jgi:hypothetical protein
MNLKLISETWDCLVRKRVEVRIHRKSATVRSIGDGMRHDHRNFRRNQRYEALRGGHLAWLATTTCLLTFRDLRRRI